MKRIVTIGFGLLTLLSLSAVGLAQEETGQATDRTAISSPDSAANPDGVAAKAVSDDSATTAPAAADTDANGEAVSAAPVESPEHVAARQQVEELKSKLDAETKSKQDVEKRLADSQSDSQRNMLQGILQTKQEAVDITTQDLKDATESLAKTPFSKASNSDSQP